MGLPGPGRPKTVNPPKPNSTKRGSCSQWSLYTDPMRSFRLSLLTAAAALGLGSCSLVNRAQPTTFGPDQTWNVQGKDGETLVYATVNTRSFSEFSMDRPELTGPQAKVRVRSNIEPLLSVRLLFPGATPLIVQEVQTTRTDFTWNGGVAGRLYRCRVTPRAGQQDEWLIGELTRVDQGQDTALGGCTIQLTKAAPPAPPKKSLF